MSVVTTPPPQNTGGQPYLYGRGGLSLRLAAFQYKDCRMSMEEFLSRLYDAGRWFMISRDMMGVFTMEEVVMLSYLCNVSAQKENDSTSRIKAGLLEGWFRCSTAKVLHNLKISKWQHDRILNSLIKKGVVKRKQIGVPAKRFMYVDYSKIEEMVMSYTPPSSDSE